MTEPPPLPPTQREPDITICAGSRWSDPGWGLWAENAKQSSKSTLLVKGLRTRVWQKRLTGLTSKVSKLQLIIYYVYQGYDSVSDAIHTITFCRMLISIIFQEPHTDSTRKQHGRGVYVNVQRCSNCWTCGGGSVRHYTGGGGGKNGKIFETKKDQNQLYWLGGKKK